MINGHGNDIHHTTYPIKADFSSNVAGRKTPDSLLRFLGTQLETVANYPEPDSQTLRETLGKRYDVSASQVFVTNGSVEAFYLIALAYRNARSVVCVPAFAEYEDACRMHCHAVSFQNLGDFEQTVHFQADTVWLANPNNPDGRLHSIECIRQKLRDNPETVFVLDEAYGELCTGFESAVSLLSELDNLIVIKSFTKQYVLPGLRLGYAVTSRPIAEKIRPRLLPWSVNALAQKMGLFLLNEKQEDLPDIRRLLKASVAFQHCLATLPNIEIIPSSCNFFLVRLLKGNSSVLKEKLLQKYGLLIRDAANFRGLDERFIRISVQSDEDNELLYQALKKEMQLF